MSFNFVFNINIRLFQEAQKWITLSNEKSILKYFPVSENYFYVNLFFFYLLTVQLPLHITFCLGRKWNKCMLLIFYIMGLLPDFPSLAYLQYSQSVQSLSRVQPFVTPQTASYQASLSITNSQSLLRLMSI